MNVTFREQAIPPGRTRPKAAPDDPSALCNAALRRGRAKQREPGVFQSLRAPIFFSGVFLHYIPLSLLLNLPRVHHPLQDGPALAGINF